MTDVPDVHGTPSKGMSGFLTTNTAGMPNWVWGLVIVGGIGLALAVKYYFGKSGNATTTGTTPDSGLGLAVDPTTGLPYAVEGLVPAGGTVGNQPPPVPTPTPTPTPFTWPTSLQGMKIWEGTNTHEFFYGPKGPQPGRADQTPLSTLFPAGTKFSDPGGGKAGDAFYYTLPDTGTPIKAPVPLVNPNPPSGHSGGPSALSAPSEMLTTWPGDSTTQVRIG